MIAWMLGSILGQVVAYYLFDATVAQCVGIWLILTLGYVGALITR